MKKIVILLPLFFTLLIFIFLLIFLLEKKDPQKPPSALLNENIPKFQTNNLFDNNSILSNQDINNKITIINFFASWCAPCRAEHHLFFEIKKHKPELYILGFSHKDDPSDSKKYLEEEGNPYSFVGLDQDGKIAFEFGVFGLPETFIINNDGKIIFKHMGALTKKIIEDEISVFF